jgi:hypothetical protein
MIKKFLTIVIIFLFFGLILTPNIYADSKTSLECVDNKKQSNDLTPVISVSGGFGIHIEIEGANDDTSIILTLEDAMIRYINRNDAVGGSINIFVAVLDLGSLLLLFDTFVLHISVGNNLYSYQCQSFLLVFTYNFTPIEYK